jgi:RNA polymerase sigma factor (TIGR02999 family)
MSNVSLFIDTAAEGDKKAAELLPLVYDELRRLAAARLANEPDGISLDSTSLVHEAFLRIVGAKDLARWANRGHFFAAAAEAMRRILVDRARKKATAKRGSGACRVPLDDADRLVESPLDLLSLNDALTRFAAVEPRKAELVQLRFFAGLSSAEAAIALGVSLATAERWWAFARTWLYSDLGGT